MRKRSTRATTVECRACNKFTEDTAKLKICSKTQSFRNSISISP